ncbi:MAG: hypothetical protein M1324_04340 [Patescibacteria group bacterium]|nr:hypothetical protein [Patescibacteria group bacterium]
MTLDNLYTACVGLTNFQTETIGGRASECETKLVARVLPLVDHDNFEEFIDTWLCSNNEGGVAAVATHVLHNIVLRSDLFRNEVVQKKATEHLLGLLNYPHPAIRSRVVAILFFMKATKVLHDPNAVAARLTLIQNTESDPVVREAIHEFLHPTPR